MQLDLLFSNLSNPSFLFFVLGILAVRLKSDLEIPGTSSKFISYYLLFAIGFKGGQELAHNDIGIELLYAVLFAIAISCIIPIYSFFILKKRLSVFDAVAIASSYGSVSAVTFVTAVNYLENVDKPFHGEMVAIMALMESPAIIAGLILLSFYSKESTQSTSRVQLIKHSFTNGSVLLILGSLVIGLIANEHQAEGIKPFTNDIFQGFLVIFLLDMGISSGKKIGSLLNNGIFPVAFAVIMPLFNGCVVSVLSQFVTDDISNRFIFAILAASASYIAVPAAMKIAVPKADPGLYLPMALAITFPINITIGMPVYMYMCEVFP